MVYNEKNLERKSFEILKTTFAVCSKRTTGKSIKKCGTPPGDRKEKVGFLHYFEPKRTELTFFELF